MVEKRAILFGIVLVVLDQATKFWARTSLVHAPVDLGLVILRYVENTGAAFGLLRGQNIILILVTLVVVALLIYYRDSFTKQIRDKYFLCAILGGALGNLIDRATLGFVVDFIDLGFWPVFNVADICLTLGVIALVASTLYEEKRK